MLAQRKRKQSLIIPPDESTSSSRTAPKRMKFPSMSPLRGFANSTSPHPLATLPLSNNSSTPLSITSEPRPAPHQTALSLKKMLWMSKKFCPSPLSLGTQTVDLRLWTPRPLVSWNDFVSYGAAIPSELSFAARCSHSHDKAPPIRKTPSRSQPYPYPKTLWTHPLLDQFPWHPNRMLLSDTVPVVDVNTNEQQEAWRCLYIKFRDSFRSQMS